MVMNVETTKQWLPNASADHRPIGPTCEIVDFIYMLNGQTPGGYMTAMLWHVQFARRVRGEEPQVMSHDSYPECKPCDVGNDKLLHWEREYAFLWHGSDKLLHCALGMCPWRTDGAVCSTVRLQCSPTTSTKNCNCETFPQFSTHLDHCPHNKGRIHNLSRDCICGITTDFCTSGPLSAQ